MKIIGLAKPNANGNQNLVVTLTEIEADKITGVAGKQHTPHRYQAGTDVNIGKIYNLVGWINKHKEAIKSAMVTTQASAAEIENSLPLEDS